MSGKLLLIDGHSILNRAFYGVPDLTNSEGLHTNAVYGFLNIMFKVLDEEKPDYITVAFDVKHPTFRHEMFKEYKGTRKPMPAELHEQVPVLKNLLKAMNIQTMELPGFEADDLLGTLAKRAEHDGNSVRIVSGDRDLLQLATENIMIRIPKTKQGGTEVENYLAKDVLEKYQVTPLEFIDMKALMGDVSDNIPGVAGIGEKTAAKIISAFHSIENAYEHIDEIQPKRAGNLLKEGYDSAMLSKVLATINTEVPLEIDYKNGTLDNMYTSEALEIITKLEFKKLADKFRSNGVEAIAENNIDIKNIIKTVDPKELPYNLIKKFGQIGFYAVKIKGSGDEPVQLTFDFLNTDNQNASSDFYVTAIACGANDNPAIYVTEFDNEAEYRKLIKYIYDERIHVSTFEFKSLIKSCDEFFKWEHNRVLDCGIGAYLLNPLKDDYTYENLAKEHLNIIADSISELKGKLDNESLYKENKQNLTLMISWYALIAFKSYNVITDKLAIYGMDSLYTDIEYPLIYSLARMENEGILVNATELKNYGNRLKESIEVIEQEIYKEIGEVFNINSPKQLGEILFGKMMLPGGKKTKTGYSTSADVLEKLAPDYPIVNKILEYRQLTKLKSTYADGLANYIGSDGRIHGTFNQTITATGRISSTEPNLQNIPIRMPIGKELRKVFIPKEGCMFIDADYSQIELRILAHMSGDKSLIDAYNSAQDIHKITASKVFNTPFSEVTELQRRNAKAVNFGIVYGISSFGLSQDLSISRKEASEYIKQYFETYPGIKAFLDNTIDEAKKTGCVRTLFGRLRPIPELKSSNFMQRSFGERIAMNSPIQGTAADIMKIAMIEVDRRLINGGYKSRIVLQVHDELLLEVYKNEFETVKSIVEEAMSSAADLLVKLEIGVESGTNWLEAH